MEKYQYALYLQKGDKMNLQGVFNEKDLIENISRLLGEKLIFSNNDKLLRRSKIDTRLLNANLLGAFINKIEF